MKARSGAISSFETRALRAPQDEEECKTMQKRNATGRRHRRRRLTSARAIAKKFAAEGYTVFAGRRNGDKLAPLVKRDRKPRAASIRRARARRAQGRRDHCLPQRRRRTRAAGGLHLQYRRQRQLPDPGNHRARVPQGLGDGAARPASSPAARPRA